MRPALLLSSVAQQRGPLLAAAAGGCRHWVAAVSRWLLLLAVEASPRVLQACRRYSAPLDGGKVASQTDGYFEALQGRKELV